MVPRQFGRSASAWNLWDVVAKTVIRCEFLPGFNRPYAVHEYVIPNAPVLHVRIATVIDNLGAAAAYRSVGVEDSRNTLVFRVGSIQVCDQWACVE